MVGLVCLHQRQCLHFILFAIDETRTDPRREGDFEMCIDRYGKNVSHGKLYLPDEDPCTACTCNNGAREGCRMVTCEEPHCQNFVRSRDACCGYTCIETHVSNITSKLTLYVHWYVSRHFQMCLFTSVHFFFNLELRQNLRQAFASVKVEKSGYCTCAALICHLFFFSGF